MFALTAAGSAKAYTEQGYQHYPLRTFLTPVEQTARLSKMGVVPPYVLFDSLKAPNSDAPKKHVEGYAELLKALRITLILMRPGRSPRWTPQTCQ